MSREKNTFCNFFIFLTFISKCNIIVCMIGDKIRELLKQNGENQYTASEKLGVSQGGLNLWINNKRRPSPEDIEKICKLFNVSPNFLFESETNTIPVIGYVQAGLWQEAIQWDQTDFKPIYMPTDEVFKGKRVYALEIRGDSMNLLYPPGSCVVCVSAEDYYDCVGEIESGKKVVVRRVNPMDQTIEATVKQYIKSEQGTYLVPQSTNSNFKPIRIDDGSAGDTKITGVVIGSFRKE